MCVKYIVTIKKAKIRRAVYKTLGEYGLASPPLADDLAEALFEMLKAVEQKIHPTFGDAASDSESKPAPKRVI